ncbi:MAG: phosphotransferase [Bacillota bacterium]
MSRLLARHELLSILAAWGLSPETVGAISPVLDVFRVETPTGPLNLKWSRRSEDHLLFVARGLEYVYQRGFRSCSLPLPTTDGRPFLPYRGRHYLLFRWIEGERVTFIHRAELIASCCTLARFHAAARGFPAEGPGGDRRAWRKLLSSFARRQRELEESLRLIADRDLLAERQEDLWPAAAYHLALASFARRLLGPLKAQGGVFAEDCLCHNDVAARNFILTPAGEAALIDFDAMRRAPPLFDLWKIFRRALVRLDWSFEAGLAMLEAYEGISPLSPAELLALLALLAFPHKLWRLGRRFRKAEEEKEKQKYARRIRRLCAQTRSYGNFLTHLADLCRSKGATIEGMPVLED